MEIPKHLRLKVEQVTLWKLTVGLHCQGQHQHSSLNVERSSWCIHGDFTPTLSSLCCERYSATYRTWILDTSSATKPSTYNRFCLQKVLGQWRPRICGSGQPSLVLTWDPCHERAYTAWMTRKQRLDSPETWGTVKHGRKKISEMTPNHILLYS